MSLNPVYVITSFSDSDLKDFRKEFKGYCAVLEGGGQVHNAIRFYQLYNTILGLRKEFTGTCNSCLKRMMSEFIAWEILHPEVEEKPKSKNKKDAETKV